MVFRNIERLSVVIDIRRDAERGIGLAGERAD
jgi:hypothetical protein